MIKGPADATKIAIAIVLAALIIALAIYMRPIPNRFEFRMAGSQIQRFDTVTGETMFCPDDSPCFGYDRNGNPVGNQQLEQENRAEAPDEQNWVTIYRPPVPNGFVVDNQVTGNSASGASR